nr:MAG TPA: hypothetical protein [Caudoviricetes sp.]
MIPTAQLNCIRFISYSIFAVSAIRAISFAKLLDNLIDARSSQTARPANDNGDHHVIGGNNARHEVICGHAENYAKPCGNQRNEPFESFILFDCVLNDGDHPIHDSRNRRYTDQFQITLHIPSFLFFRILFQEIFVHLCFVFLIGFHRLVHFPIGFSVSNCNGIGIGEFPHRINAFENKHILLCFCGITLFIFLRFAFEKPL